jgi:hypothetical protein
VGEDSTAGAPLKKGQRVRWVSESDAGQWCASAECERLPLPVVSGNRFFQQRHRTPIRTRAWLIGLAPPAGFAAAALLAVALVGSTPRLAEVSTRGGDATVVLGAGVAVAQGVTLYRPDTRSVAELPQPLAVQALALDPGAVDLTTALSLGRQQGRATVSEAARREGAIAGVNAGFFALATGDPTGVLRVDGDLVSEGRLLRGAVAISSGVQGVRLVFDRVRVKVSLDVRVGSGWREAPLDGVDTVRRLNGATLYTSRFGPDTATPATGVEWLLSAAGLRPRPTQQGPRSAATLVSESRVTKRILGGASAIPAGGAVLSFGGAQPPAPFDRLVAGGRVRMRQTWETETPGHVDAFARADDVVGGAGLLVKDGRAIDDWSIEQTGDSLRTVRHPRTMIGADAGGRLWLVTIDGRQPGYSVGVTMPELRQLAQALGLTQALNLDGGGSTTMVVKGEIVNRPSDAVGPRTVSDVLLVRPRPGPPARAPR